MKFDVKIENNPAKDASKNIVFFYCIFIWVLEGFGKGFGEVLGLLWENFEGFFRRIPASVAPIMKLVTPGCGY